MPSVDPSRRVSPMVGSGDPIPSQGQSLLGVASPPDPPESGWIESAGKSSKKALNYMGKAVGATVVGVLGLFKTSARATGLGLGCVTAALCFIPALFAWGAGDKRDFDDMMKEAFSLGMMATDFICVPMQGMMAVMIADIMETPYPDAKSSLISMDVESNKSIRAAFYQRHCAEMEKVEQEIVDSGGKKTHALLRAVTDATPLSEKEKEDFLLAMRSRRMKRLENLEELDQKEKFITTSSVKLLLICMLSPKHPPINSGYGAVVSLVSSSAGLFVPAAGGIGVAATGVWAACTGAFWCVCRPFEKAYEAYKGDS